MGFQVGTFRVAIASAEMKVAIQTRAINATVAQGRKPNSVNQHLCLLGCRDMRDHQAGGAVFEVSIESALFQRGRPQHAVDVVQVKVRQERLDFTVVHSAMFKVKPDAVEAKVGRVTDICRNEMTKCANSD